MQAPLRRKILIGTIGAVVAAGLIYGFLPKPVEVEVVPAKRGPLRVAVEEEGRTRVKDRFVVSAPVTGYLRRIELEAGAPVRKGQTVALLEPLRSTVLDPRSRAEAEAAAAAARSNLDAAREKARAAASDEEYSRERNNRMRKLFADGYIAKDDLDQSETDAKKADAVALAARASVSAAEAELTRAESVLAFSAADRVPQAGKTVAITSPVNGRILKLLRESEGVVNSGDPIMDVGDPAKLEVKAEILSADAVRIRRGMPVVFERWGGDRPLTGRVRLVEPAGFTKISSLGVEEQRVLVIAGFDSPPELWQGLGDGYRLDASFVIWEGNDVLQVPASALFRKGEDWALFTIEGGRARIRTVTPGHRNGLAAEITAGLTGGESVIQHPDDRLQENVRVKIR